MENRVVVYSMYCRMIIIGIQVKPLSLMRLSLEKKMRDGLCLSGGGRVRGEEWMVSRRRNDECRINSGPGLFRIFVYSHLHPLVS